MSCGLMRVALCRTNGYGYFVSRVKQGSGGLKNVFLAACACLWVAKILGSRLDLNLSLYVRRM